MVQKLQVLFAFAYGHRGPDGRGGNVPGLSNEVMAQVIKDQRVRYDRVSGQQEIGSALKDIGVDPDFEVLYGGREYLTTEQVIDAMLEDLRREGVDPKSCDIWVLCKEIHWSGLKWILQARGIKPRRVTFVTTSVGGWREVPYDRQSAQFQGRNAFNAWLYKIWAGFKKLAKGEISIFGPKAQGGNVATATTATAATPAAATTQAAPLWKVAVGLIAIFVAIAGLLIGGVKLKDAYRDAYLTVPVTNVEVGRLYNVMIYPCDATFAKTSADGKTVTEIERMYDVVFIGQNREMMHQMIHPQFVRKSGDIRPGQGGWVQLAVSYPTIEGIKYGTDGWRREFRFNGDLQPPSSIPACRPRQ